MPISSQEFNDYGGLVQSQPTPVELPVPYSKSTRTSVGRATTWSRPAGTGISKQSMGSFLSFDEDAPTAMPEADKGARYVKE